MATLKGQAIVWGVGLSADTNGWAAGTIVASHEVTLDASQREILNSIGDAVGLVFSNVKRSITVEVIPAHASSVSTAQTGNVLPSIGTVVRIGDSMSTDVDGTHSGDYVFVGGSKRASQDGEQRMTMNLVQYIANNVATAAS